MLLFQVALFSQNANDNNLNDHKSKFDRYKKIDSLINVDFLDYEYKHLDKDFQIHISSNDFNKLVEFNQTEVKTYKDSLMIVLIDEFDHNYAAVNISFHRILFDWKKLSYYLWETETKVKTLGSKSGFSHPYRFFKYLKDDKITDKKRLDILKYIRSKVTKSIGRELISDNAHDLLNVAFKENPQRIKDLEEYKKRKSNHKK
jgi:hypothetical protein